MSPNRSATFDIDAVFRAGDMNINTYMEMQGLEGGVQIDISKQTPELSAADRFVVEEAVARGGMGMILAARDVNIRRVTAMKVLTAENPTDKQLLRFIEEAQITGQLEHPNIVPVHELGISDSGRVYYTMKMVEGVTLLDIIKGIREHRREIIDKFPASRLLTIFAKVCDAVAFAHSRGVIHRDLKPDNVMIGDFGEVLLMDWGLAKVVGEHAMSRGMVEEDGVSLEEAAKQIRDRRSMAAQRTLEGQILGTPNYMPPEQAAGKISELDNRTDIYALGGILYDLLCLRAPIDGANLKEMVAKIKKGDIPLPNIYNPRRNNKGKLVYPDGIILHHCPEHRVPEPIAAVAMKAMAVEPGDRYQTVEQLQDDIFKYQTGFATSAESASVLKQLWLTFKRHKRESIFVAISLILLVSLTAFFILHLNAKNSELVETIERMTALEGQQDAWEDELVPSWIEEAEQAFEQGKWEEGVRKLEQAIYLRPDNAHANFVKARGQMAFFKLDQALKYFDRASELGEAYAQQAKPYVSVLRRSLPSWEINRSLSNQQLSDLAQAVRSFDEPMAKKIYDEITNVEIGAAEFLTVEQERAIQRTLEVAYGKLEIRNGLAAKEVRILDQIRRQSAEVHVQFIRNANRIRDISPLSEVKTITHLELKGTSVTDLSPLKGIKLRELNLRQTKISDLTPLSESALTMLNIERTPVSTLAGLPTERFRKLLATDAGTLADISALKGAPIVDLQLKGTQVIDLGPLAGNTTLQTLSLETVDVSDLSPLAGLPLQDLRLYRTKVRELTPLAGSPLRRLDIRQTAVRDLTPLATLKQLDYLNIVDNSITSLAALKDLPLTQLYADKSKLTSLTGLEGTKLSILLLADTKIRDLAPLRGLPLKRLVIAGTQVEDLTPLAGMQLENLDLSYTGIKDLSVLSKLPLKELDLTGCRSIQSLEPLRSCKQLTEIRLPAHVDPCVLKGLPNLRRAIIKRGEKWVSIDTICP